MGEDAHEVLYTVSKIEELEEGATESDVWRELHGDPASVIGSVAVHMARQAISAEANPDQSRGDLKRAGEGMLTENYERASARDSSLMTDGMAYYAAVGLKAGDVVSGGVLLITTGGTAVSLSKMGLYSSAGARLAISADQGTAWQGTGFKVAAFLTPYEVETDGLYYAAFVAKAATTLPSPARAWTSGLWQTDIGSGLRPWYQQAAQTDLPATATFAGTSVSFWAALTGTPA